MATSGTIGQIQVFYRNHELPICANHDIYMVLDANHREEYEN